ncbi:glutamate decarboxylase [Flagelloscypha sp. PMI_526]|nr:glutamate decarboxylase [Flagelloscypha sp. PMI_526]
MSLSRHLDAQEIVERCQDHPHRQYTQNLKAIRKAQHSTSSYNRDDDAVGIPKFEIPPDGIPSRAAAQLIRDQLSLDGNPLLNLASFVHTWMPEEAEKLIMENLNKNQVDQDEYPATQVIHNRCVSMLADLWNAPKSKDGTAVGTSTAGSSEAIMLGGLAMKKRWQEKRKAENKDYFHPNIVFGSNAQVALEKFARYWDVEARLVPVNKATKYVMKPEDAIPFIDENTIGVIVIFGSTYTGEFEDVEKMSTLLDELQERTGLDVPIHVDAASGGFVGPFAYPDLKWDFRVPRVVSINTSGHKFGLVYPGLGWVIWRNETCLHKDLVFELHYLGSVEYSYTLNFSKPAAPVIAQLFNFINLGKKGYTDIINKDFRHARVLARALESTYFEVLSNIHRPVGASGFIDKVIGEEHADKPASYAPGLPVVSFRFSEKVRTENPNLQQAWVQALLRARGWIVPNYNAPKGEEETEMLRVVVRETMSEDLTERLIVDILQVTESLLESASSLALQIPLKAASASHGEQEPARPTKENFGDGGEEKGQKGFARQC